MTTPLIPPAQSSYTDAVERYRTLSIALTDAIAEHTLAKAAYENARDHYEDKKRELIIQGIPGAKERMTSDERDALISRALKAEIIAIRNTRDILRGAESALEVVRVQERAERETLRIMQRDMEYHAARAQVI